MISEADARLVAAAVAREFPRVETPADPMWRTTAAAKVIDCVLSLNRPYETVVAPRVAAFVEQHPGVRTCGELLDFIGSFASAEAFATQALQFASKSRGATIVGVAQYLQDAAKRFEGGTEDERLGRWAKWARPGDYIAVGVTRFGLAGFQYLRMLFGAETTKPDVHIVRYVSRALGRTVTDVQALYVLERAAEVAGLPLRSLDAAIWNAGAKRG